MHNKNSARISKLTILLVSLCWVSVSHAAPSKGDKKSNKGLARQVSALAVETQSLQNQINNIEAGNGSQGPQGIQGDVGPQGTQGETGIQGIQGSIGPQGIQGETGPQGIAGPTGDTGQQGDTGEQGIAGETGATGAQGITGDQGETGLTGDVGPQGIQGPQGDIGEQGIVGATGATGAQGEAGLTGDVGPQGIQGPQGDTGEQGIVGATGAQGETGATGAEGAQGIQGLQGEAGLQGLQGITGDQGIQGLTGATGEQGIQGDTGPQGPQGEAADLFEVQTQINEIVSLLEIIADELRLDGPMVTCADFLQTEIWGRNIKGFDLRPYTNSTLHFLGAHPYEATCEEDDTSMTINALGSKLIVAADPGNIAGDVNTATSFYCASGDNPGLVNGIVANAPVVNALCRSMGYQTGLITGIVENTCPYIENLDANGSSWDIGNTAGRYYDAVEGITCIQ